MLGSHSSASEFVILARVFLHSPCKDPCSFSDRVYKRRYYLGATGACTSWYRDSMVTVGRSWHGSTALCTIWMVGRTWTKGQSLIGSNDGYSTAGPVDVPSKTGPPRPDVTPRLRKRGSVAALGTEGAPRLRRGAGRPGETGDGAWSHARVCSQRRRL